MSSEFFSYNPFNGERLASYRRLSDEELEAKLSLSEKAAKNWATSSIKTRAGLLSKLASALEKRIDDLALIVTNEMGKPIAQSRSEIEKCAWVCRYYAENAENFLQPDRVKGAGEIHYRPLGSLLAIMPWNFPFWQAFRVLAPNIAAGNTVLLKHASNVPGCASAMEELFSSVSDDKHIFLNLFLESKRITSLIKDKRIAAVTLTGSTDAGRSVASAAGESLKKCVLELGGSDPYVVLRDANLKAAAEACARSRLINTGQSCIAAKRFIVEAPVYKDFEDLFKEALYSRTQGDPKEETTELGPLADRKFADEVESQVSKSVQKGAKADVNSKHQKDAAFYPATIVSDVKKGMPLYDQECFGPVAALIEAKDEEDAIRIANDTSFGLGAAIFTSDSERGSKLASEKLEAGCCFVNDFVKSDPRLPFGGIKESGFGRELGLMGMREFVNVKSLVTSSS